MIPLSLTSSRSILTTFSFYQRDVSYLIWVLVSHPCQPVQHRQRLISGVSSIQSWVLPGINTTTDYSVVRTIALLLLIRATHVGWQHTTDAYHAGARFCVKRKTVGRVLHSLKNDVVPIWSAVSCLPCLRMNQSDLFLQTEIFPRRRPTCVNCRRSSE